MSARTPSRERTIGRTVLADPLLAEALEAFAEKDDRNIPNAVDFLLHRVLLEWGWLAHFPARGYIAGPHLEAHRHRDDPEEAGGIVVPFLPRQAAGVRT